MSAAAEVIMCEYCGQRKSQALVTFTSKGMRGLEKEMCLPCFDKLTEKQGLTYREWCKQKCREEWTDNHGPLPSLTNGYESYCKDNGLIACWDG